MISEMGKLLRYRKFPKDMEDHIEGFSAKKKSKKWNQLQGTDNGNIVIIQNNCYKKSQDNTKGEKKFPRISANSLGLKTENNVSCESVKGIGKFKNKHNSGDRFYKSFKDNSSKDRNNSVVKAITTAKKGQKIDDQQKQPIKARSKQQLLDVQQSYLKEKKKISFSFSHCLSPSRKGSKSKIYDFMKDFLKKRFCTRSTHEDIYVEFPNNLRVINNNLRHRHQNEHQEQSQPGQQMNNYPSDRSEHQEATLEDTGKYQFRKEYPDHSKNNRYKIFDMMQDIRIRVEQPTHGSPNTQRRPLHLFPPANIPCNDNECVPRSPSSEEDNSPTEMNNCRRLVDKPPLVKRLTMGLLRSTEDSRPLVHNTSPSLKSGSSQTISDGYVNEGICEPEKLISSKFGDSCRQSLTAIPLENLHIHDGSEFNFKKKYLRETSSANSSPKIFAPSAPLRIDSLSLQEQNELKGAAWFQAGIPREISLEVLSRQSPGAFLVRQSSTKPGCFALSLRVPPPAPKVAHYLILRTPRGYKIKGFTKEFSSLRALITHHSVMPELLPVPLSLPRPTHNIPPRRDLDDFDTYGSLNDFRKMMSDLNV